MRNAGGPPALSTDDPSPRRCARPRRRAVRRGSVRHHVPRRPGRRGHQDRTACGRRLLPRRRAVLLRRARQRVLPRVQPQQEEHDAQSAPSRGQGDPPRPGRVGGRRRFEPARRRAGKARAHPCAPSRAQPAHRVRALERLRPDRTAGELARIRLPDAGRGGLVLADRRARWTACPLRPLGGRSDDRPGGWATRCSRASSALARAAWAATST